MRWNPFDSIAGNPAHAPAKSGRTAFYPLLLAAVVMVSFAATVWIGIALSRGDTKREYKAYSYYKLTASNKIVLHALRTTPDNIVLKAIAENVTRTGETGINGGFFYNGDILSLAVMNNKPVKGVPGDYGTGWYNTDRPRGTLVWDAAAGMFSVQVVEESDQINVSDRSRFWAQGGVSMGLLNEPGWEQQAIAEEMPAMDEERMRSAMAYDADRNVWLIVTPTPCTIPAFREAIKERIAKGKLMDGIFLDGDGSSQLKAGKTALAGDSRPVYQMIALIRK